MNRAYRKPKFETMLPLAARPLLAAASNSLAAHASPARAMQANLARSFAYGERRWSPRRTLAFVLLTCGGFWALVIWTAMSIH
jgi:hypothetical protein